MTYSALRAAVAARWTKRINTLRYYSVLTAALVVAVLFLSRIAAVR